MVCSTPPERSRGACYTPLVDYTAQRAEPLADTVLTGRSRLVAVLVIGIGVCTLYGAIGAYTARGPFYQLETALDRSVPLQPAWVLVYLMIFFLAAAPLASIRDRRVLARTIGAYLTLYATAVPLWLWFPVTVPRPALPIVDLWTYGVALTRFIDPPSNCMPSMHVALSVMAALVVRRLDRAMGWVLLGSAPRRREQSPRRSRALRRVRPCAGESLGQSGSFGRGRTAPRWSPGPQSRSSSTGRRTV